MERQAASRRAARSIGTRNAALTMACCSATPTFRPWSRRSAANPAMLSSGRARERRVFEIVIETAAAQRVRELACAVAGQYDLRHVLRMHGAEFGHGDLVVREHFEQEGLEGFVGAVDLVDQQHAGRVARN